MADTEARPETPSQGKSANKIPEEKLAGMSDFARKRLEKDLLELERLIQDHFTQRKKDEEELGQLQGHC